MISGKIYDVRLEMTGETTKCSCVCVVKYHIISYEYGIPIPSGTCIALLEYIVCSSDPDPDPDPDPDKAYSGIRLRQPKEKERRWSSSVGSLLRGRR